MMLLRCCCLKSQIQRQRSNWEGGPCPSVANDRLRQMLIGYARVSKADGSQSLDLQRDALRAEGIDDAANLYHAFASGVRDDRPGLDSCLRALRKGDVLVVWKLGRLGRNLAHLVNTVQDLTCPPAAWACGCLPARAPGRAGGRRAHGARGAGRARAIALDHRRGAPQPRLRGTRGGVRADPGLVPGLVPSAGRGRRAERHALRRGSPPRAH